MKKESINSQVVEALRICEIDKEYKRKEIIKIVVDFCGCNISSVMPSDYCYNRVNKDINYEKSIHLFLYLERNRYKYCGPNFSYTGPIYHKPIGSKGDIIVGRLENGILVEPINI